MSTDGILPPPSAEEYWKEVSRILMDQVSSLMAGNTFMFACKQKELIKLQSGQDPVTHGLGQEKRQNLRDALATMTKAVEAVIE